MGSFQAKPVTEKATPVNPHTLTAWHCESAGHSQQGVGVKVWWFTIMRFSLLFILALFLNNLPANMACSANGEGVDAHGIKAAIFDGSELKEADITGSRFTAAHDISQGYYGVVFFRKNGFYPKSIIFKSSNKPLIIDIVALQPLQDRQNGICTGVVYKPVRGGKLAEHTGIVKTGKHKKITLVKGRASYTAYTDSMGIFMIELPPGKYDIIFNHKKAGDVVIEQGRTAIRNIQEGMVLID